LTFNQFFLCFFSDTDDEGIERDSEDVEDEKYSDTKELDHVLEVSLAKLNKHKLDKGIERKEFIMIMFFSPFHSNLHR
jgi:hypothetical protein